MRLWDCKSQSTKPIQVLEESRDSVSGLHLHGYEIVTGSVDGRIRLYDLRKGMLSVDVIGRTLRTKNNTDSPCPLSPFPPYMIFFLLTTIFIFFDLCFVSEPITSVQQTRDGNAVLVSSLDSAIRLMDKANGQLLQSYLGHRNQEYRIRSCLGLSDAVVISGSEGGQIFAWDLLEGSVMEQLEAHDGKVASAVACNGARKEWASAGVDGELSFFSIHE